MAPMIVVAGEALIDLLVHPDGRLAATPGGGPFNTARTIARLGGEVAFLGCLSTDRFGGELRDALASDGVDLALAATTDAPTTLAVAELDGHGAAPTGSTPRRRPRRGFGRAPSRPPSRPAPPRSTSARSASSLEPMARRWPRAMAAVRPDDAGHARSELPAGRHHRPGGLPGPIGAIVSRERRRQGQRRRPRIDRTRASAPWCGPWPRRTWAGVVLVTDGGVRSSWSCRPDPRDRRSGGRRGRHGRCRAMRSVARSSLGGWSSDSAGRLSTDPDLVDAAVRLAVEVAAVTCSRAGADPPRRPVSGPPLAGPS